jgi:hypothetical protein
VTIASRRRIYWFLFLVAAASLAASVVLGVPVLAHKVDLSVLVDAGAFHKGNFLGLAVDSARVTAVGLVAVAAFSTLCMAYILATFRKTVSSEIFFFSFWVLSLGLEVLRLLVLRLAGGSYSVGTVIFASRLVLGFRLAGLLSFFAASLYAAGFRNEKLGSALAVICFAAMTLAWAMPIDTGVHEMGFLLRPGYRTMAVAMAAVLALATVGDFFYASFAAGELSYRVVALGAGLALAGQALVLAMWQPFALLVGLGLLSLGSWLLVSRLHAYYLWQ